MGDFQCAHRKVKSAMGALAGTTPTLPRGPSSVKEGSLGGPTPLLIQDGPRSSAGVVTSRYANSNVVFTLFRGLHAPS